MTEMLRRTSAVTGLLVLAIGAAADESSLRSRLNLKISAFPGNVRLYAKNLRSGSSIGIEGEKRVRTASTIKLAIMAECFAEAAEDRLKLTEVVRLRASEKV